MRRLLPLFALLAGALLSCEKEPPPVTPPTGPCPPPAVTKGPWVMRPTQTGATVFFETREQGCVQVGLTPEAGGAETHHSGTAKPVEVTVAYGQELTDLAEKDEAGLFVMNEVALDGLTPGTCYRYRIATAPEAVGRFCTLFAPGEPFTFVALGDTAVKTGEAMKVVARAVAEPSDFILHTGDIQYYSSFVESWQMWFERMAPLLRAGAFLPTIGNHEDEIEGELEDYYLRLFERPGGGDTARWYRYETGGVHFLSLDTESPLGPGSPQITWLTAELEAAKQTPGFRFSVLYFHKPVYTLSRHAPRLDVRAAIEPLLAPNRVRMVLNGHCHSYERFEKDGVAYVVTGGGGAGLYDVNARVGEFPADADHRLAARSAHHFVRFRVGETISGQAITPEGEVFDTFELTLP